MKFCIHDKDIFCYLYTLKNNTNTNKMYCKLYLKIIKTNYRLFKWIAFKIMSFGFNMVLLKVDFSYRNKNKSQRAKSNECAGCSFGGQNFSCG